MHFKTIGVGVPDLVVVDLKRVDENNDFLADIVLDIDRVHEGIKRETRGAGLSILKSHNNDSLI